MVDLEEFPERYVPLKYRRSYEITFRHGTAQEWRKKMGGISADPARMPKLVRFQDNLNVKDGLTPEVDCLRERWLTALLPAPSPFEEPASPPTRCSSQARLALSWLWRGLQWLQERVHV